MEHTGSKGRGWIDHYEKGEFTDRKYFDFDYNSEYFVINVDKYSENIIGGVTGTHSKSVTGASNQTSIHFADVNATGNVTMTITGLASLTANGYNWGHRITVSVNTTTAYYDNQSVLNETTFILTETQFNNIELDANGFPIFNVTYSNGTNINFHVDKWINYTSYDVRINHSSAIEVTTVYFYYEANPTLTSGSDGLSTYPYFEDWSTNISTVKYDISGSSTIENGELNLTGDGSWTTHIQTLQTFSRPFILEMDARSETTTIEAILGWSDSNTNSIAFYPKSSGSTLNARYEDTPYGAIAQTTTPRRFKLVVKPTQGYAWYVNNTLLYDNAIGTHDTRELTLATYNADNPLFLDNHIIRSYMVDIPTFTMGADETGIVSVYFTSAGHANSETKITTDSSVIINGTTSEGVPITNITLNTNSTGTMNLEISMNVVENSTVETESCANGECNHNMSINVSYNITDASIRGTIDDSLYQIAEFKGNLTNTTTDANITSSIWSSGNITHTSSYIAPNVTEWYNITLVFNNASINAQTNQTCEWNLTCTITTSATDVDGNTIYWNTTINETTITGENPQFTNTSKLTLGTHTIFSNVTDLNGTIGDLPYPEDNITRTLTVSDTIAPSPVTNLANTTSEYWVNWTWTNPPESDWNHTEVWIDAAWEVNTSNAYYNWTSSEGLTVNLELKSADVRDNVNATTVTDSVTMNTTAQANQIITGW